MKVKIVHITLFLLFAFIAFAQERFISSSRNMQFFHPATMELTWCQKQEFIDSQFNWRRGILH
ncbi:MAG: hypothetical protein CM15mP83_3700 [Flavobacteriaceae bacterium]|nr:MAG: hypothetical protein CM15mP83_3700 [Flavobacteriaceae bacterium]